MISLVSRNKNPLNLVKGFLIEFAALWFAIETGAHTVEVRIVTDEDVKHRNPLSLFQSHRLSLSLKEDFTNDYHTIKALHSNLIKKPIIKMISETVRRQFIPFPDIGNWLEISDGDTFAYDIFTRHYSFNNVKPRDNRNSKRITGPGEKLLLISKDGMALFAWRKEKFRSDEQQGVNCTIFRNEGKILSSILILEAEQFAWNKWNGARLFTFINPGKIKSSNPGYCFQCAGWKRAGISKARRLVIMEKHFAA